MAEKKKQEPTIEISVVWAGKPPDGVPSKLVLTKEYFKQIGDLADKLKRAEAERKDGE